MVGSEFNNVRFGSRNCADRGDYHKIYQVTVGQAMHTFLLLLCTAYKTPYICLSPDKSTRDNRKKHVCLASLFIQRHE